VTTFEFYRFRFHFRALEPVRFSAGKAANVLRGVFGWMLRDFAPPAAYGRLFEPRTPAADRAPAGIADWPRPFVFRAAHLDGQTILPGSPFSFDIHVFDLERPVLPYFREAFARLSEQGLGTPRGRALLEGVEQIDLRDDARRLAIDPGPPSSVCLDPDPEPLSQVRLLFLTPTELKTGGALAAKPEFPILFGRLRDRLSTLRALYGAGALNVDFLALGERAAGIRLAHCDLQWEHVRRASSRTGQMHSIGGFRGEAVYRGPLAEFLPWLRAARWVGVGRQTVWGKGDVRVAAG
jgi:hypothetical protein